MSFPAHSTAEVNEDDEMAGYAERDTTGGEHGSDESGSEEIGEFSRSRPAKSAYHSQKQKFPIDASGVHFNLDAEWVVRACLHACWRMWVRIGDRGGVLDHKKFIPRS